MSAVRPSQKQKRATTNTLRENNDRLLAVVWWVMLNSLDLYSNLVKFIGFFWELLIILTLSKLSNRLVSVNFSPEHVIFKLKSKRVYKGRHAKISEWNQYFMFFKKHSEEKQYPKESWLLNKNFKVFVTLDFLDFVITSPVITFLSWDDYTAEGLILIREP